MISVGLCFLAFAAASVQAKQISGDEDKLWTFCVSGTYRPPNHYINDDGLIAGLSVDIIDAVCAEAGKRCEIVERRPTCNLDSGDDIGFIPAPPILNGECDACPNNQMGADRIANTKVQYSTPYRRALPGRFFVVKGNPKNFTQEKLEGRTLLYIVGFTTNIPCMKRLLPGYDGLSGVVVVNTLPEALEKLESGEVDALFATRTNIRALERLPGPPYPCAETTGFMSKRGSGFDEWWTPAFNRFVESGRFGEVCDDCLENHGRESDCLDLLEDL